MLAHTAEGRIIQIPMVSNESQNTVAGLVDAPLTKADELDIIILQPLGVAFTKGCTIYKVVFPDQLANKIRVSVLVHTGIG